MECKATIQGINPCTDGAVLVLHINNTDGIGDLDGDLRLTLTRWRSRRSKDANAYFHVLADKLADARRMSKPKMKNYLLFHYGQKCRDRDGQLVIIKTNADEEELINRSDIHCWYLKPAPDGTPMYVLLEHSRFYDTREMSILIDGVIEECKGQGIDTMTPAEIAEIKQRWGLNIGQHNTKL